MTLGSDGLGSPTRLIDAAAPAAKKSASSAHPSDPAPRISKILSRTLKGTMGNYDERPAVSEC